MAGFIVIQQELLSLSQPDQLRMQTWSIIKPLLSFNKDNWEQDLSVLKGNPKAVIIQRNYKLGRIYFPFISLDC